MKYFIYGLIIIALFAACKSTEEAVVEEASPEPELAEVVMDSTTSISVEIMSSNPIGGRFRFDSTSTGWSGVLETYQIETDTVRVIRSQQLVPKVEWSEFDDFINYLRIYDLPAQTDIPKYDKNPKGVRENPLNVHIILDAKRANGQSNKIDYSNPAVETAEYWQSANLITFVSYVTTEFLVVQQQIPSDK